MEIRFGPATPIPRERTPSVQMETKRSRNDPVEERTNMRV